MTIRKRLARSNLMMILIPVAIAAVLLLGGGLAVLLLKRVYLPRLGLSMAALHETGEQLETAFEGAKVVAAIYGGTVILALLAAVAATNLYLTKNLFRHIQKPLDTLVAGVKRIQDGDLDAPIGYETDDEFRPACDAVDEMAARLKASLEAQSRQQQQKQELIAGMSHDLKSPLTSIRAYTEGLLDGVAKDEKTRTRYLEIIYAKEGELETLVNRLFSFAKLDLQQAPAKLEPLDIAGTLRTIAAGFDAENLDVRLEKLPEAKALFDRELLSRCISNLLDNSRKYGARQAVISAEASEETVSIRVSDNGPGVIDTQLEKIFELGYRTDTARQNPAGGSGIGLAVVKKAAEQMHGSVRAERADGGGLCVTLTLPRAQEE